jgi:hypothetical protein
MNHQDAKWRIATTEAELSAALNPSQGPAGFKKWSDYPDAICSKDCLEGALALVRRGRPVALFIDAAGQLLLLRIPAVGRVFERWQDREQIYFAVTSAQEPFTLPLNSEFAPLIEEAASDATEVLVVDPFFDGKAAYAERWKTPPKPCHEFSLDLSTVTALDARGACELYRDIFAQDAVDPYDSGLPFRLSRRYCDTVADAVADFAELGGAVVGKVWAFAQKHKLLEVRTSSRTDCLQSWVFHVAAIARQNSGSGLWVFDPNLRLERGVTTLDKWKASLGGNLGPVYLTTADAYRLDKRPAESIYNPCFTRDPDGGEQFEDLKVARCMLACVAHEEGAPPHANCKWTYQLPDCSKVKI